MKYSCKGHKDINTEENAKTDCKQLGWFMSKTYTATSSPREGEPERERERGREKILKDIEESYRKHHSACCIKKIWSR